MNRSNSSRVSARFCLTTALLLSVSSGGCGDPGDELVSQNVDAGIKVDGGPLDGGATSSSGGTDTVANDTGTDPSDVGTDPSDAGGVTDTGADDAGTVNPDDASADDVSADGATADDASADDASSDDASSDDATAPNDGSASGDDAGDEDTTADIKVKLCNPCSASTECATAADKDAACVDQGAIGSFCGTSCKDASDCSADYVCAEASSIEGLATKQCVRSKQAGECECSDSATGLSTSCFAADPTGAVKGQCPGTRSCTPKGLSACSAVPPQAEACNGVDDDCNGKVDDATCDDANPCTTDSCGGKDGCKNEPVTSACNDGSACTDKDACKDGKCAGDAVSCDDGNACTKDACDAAAGCTATDAEGACDDGNGCTADDACKAGACTSGTPKDCDDSDACTVDSCDAKTGDCGHDAAADGGPCSDGDACTTGDKCTAGKCGGDALKCDDDNACTDDKCDSKDGCVSANNQAKCDDNNACTATDTCAAGKCAGTDTVCDDANPCTDDSCDPQTGCVTKANNAECDDGSKCTEKDGCKDGKCTGASVVCDDSNPCTDDGCDLAKGCTVSDNTAVCTDDDACTTGDKCADGKCATEAIKCDDGNSCTDDSCDKKDGCKSAANTASCDDGNACTEKDVCEKSTCAAGAPKDCDDKDACTADSCSPSSGQCNHKKVEGCKGCTEDKQCDDGNPCVTNTCAGGACDNKTLDDGSKCSDGNFCTVDDTCKKGLCFPGKGNDCDDSNPCTSDSCDVKNAKCLHSSLAAKSKCGEKVAVTEYKCISSGVYVRYAYPGCNGDDAKPVCGVQPATLHWTDLKKVEDCKAPNVCHIENEKGVCGPPKVPDLTITVIKPDKTTYPAGSTIKLQWEVANKGNGEAGPSYLNFYTSTTKGMSPGQYSKGGINLPKIPAGGTIKGVRDVYLHSGWGNRTLYVGAMVDRFAKVTESNEDNNALGVPFKVTSAIDLYPTNANKPSVYTHGWGQTATYYWYVYNSGIATAGKSTVQLFYSEDQKFDKTDILLASADVGALKYKQQAKGSLKYTMPKGNAKPGIRYLLVVADAKQVVAEGNESNNVLWYKINYLGYHDLQALKVEAPATVIERGSVTLTMTAKSASNVTSGTFYDRIYASKDTVLGGDILLATYTRKAIAAGAAYGGKVTISLSNQTKLTSGDWNLLYVTDQTNTHKEVNEKNNLVSTKIKVVAMPQLKPYYLASQATQWQGDTRYYTSYDRNYGTAKAGAYKVRHYLSLDKTIDKDDVVMVTRSVAELKPNATAKTTSVWKIPLSQKPGEYYVIVHTDFEDKVKESNETDNTRWFKFVVKGRPDLRSVSLSASSTNVTAGDTIDIAALTRNTGGGNAGSFNDRLFWAASKTTNGAYLIKTFAQAALPANTTAKPVSLKFTVPKTATTRTYWLTYYADAFKTVSESNENNNLRFLAINVQGIPDLKGYQHSTAGSSFKAGNTVTVYGGVRNYGSGPAGKFRVGLYLSSDAKYSKDDALLKTITRTGLKQYTNTSVTTSMVLPSNLKSGTYYVIQVIDDQSQVAETSETNNVLAYKITVSASPDLVAKKITVKTSPVKAGGYLEGTVEHGNDGGAATGVGFAGSFYVSNDKKIGNDILQASNTFIALPAAKSETATYKFALNAAVKPGKWWLYYFVDSGLKVSEGNEHNNIVWLELDVK